MKRKTRKSKVLILPPPAFPLFKREEVTPALTDEWQTIPGGTIQVDSPEPDPNIRFRKYNETGISNEGDLTISIIPKQNARAARTAKKT